MAMTAWSDRLEVNSDKQNFRIGDAFLSCMSWVSFDSRYRDVLLGAALGVSLVVTSASLATYVHRTRRPSLRKKAGPEFSARPIELRSDEIVDGVAGLVGEPRHSDVQTAYSVRPAGNTPLIRINSLSNALGVEILVR